MCVAGMQELESLSFASHSMKLQETGSYKKAGLHPRKIQWSMSQVVTYCATSSLSDNTVVNSVGKKTVFLKYMEV